MSKKEERLSRKIKRLLRRIGAPRWLHRFGPKTYELWQHLFAFVAMATFRLSLRRVSKMLAMLGFEVPTFSALCKSRKRISPSLLQRILALTAGATHECVAIDSTGISTANPSFHFVKRIDRARLVKSFVKQSVLFDVEKKKFVSLRVRVKPRHDVKDARYLLQRSDAEILLGDTAYDAEWLHEYCFARGIQTIIKPRANVKKGFYRRKQMKNYSPEKYYRRSLIESGFSAVKRKYGGFTLAKSWRAINFETYLKAIAFNLELKI